MYEYILLWNFQKVNYYFGIFKNKKTKTEVLQYMSSLLDRIFKLQKASGCSANHITRELGLAVSSFTDWKKGRCSPSLDAIIKLSDFFDVSLDYLVLGHEHGQKPVESYLSQEDTTLLEKYHSLPSECKSQLNTYLDAMLDTLKVVSDQTKKLSS